MSCTYKEAGPRRRPHFSFQGSPIKREALQAIYHYPVGAGQSLTPKCNPRGSPTPREAPITEPDVRGSRPMPEA